jgi:hypothetical protein
MTSSCDLHSSQNIPNSGEQIQKNEVDRACNTYGGRQVYTGFWWGNLRETGHLEDARIIKMGLERHVLDSSGSGQEQVAGTFKHSNESSGSIKYEEFLN